MDSDQATTQRAPGLAWVALSVVLTLMVSVVAHNVATSSRPWALFVPVVFAMAPVFFWRPSAAITARVLATAALLLTALTTSLSFFLLPAAGTMLFAALVAERRRGLPTTDDREQEHAAT
jgi:hypothetical protein